jgi:glycosyltransferase involved in cell wall biosynthesis
VRPEPTPKPTARLPVSVCLIAGAEAHRLRRALDSVAGWTSEIVVVLNEEVSDGTDRIAETYGAKVFREPWNGFVAQKNSVADKATQPWLLGLDADEEVSPELRDEILAALQQPDGENRHAAYSFPRCTFYCGRWIRHGDWYPDRKVLLWRRRQGRWGGVDPHAALIVTGTVGRLRHDLRHYSMESIEHHVRKAITYGNTFMQQRAPTSRRVGLLTLWVRPAWRFCRSYFLRLGFLDGWQGYLVAYMVAFETFLRYGKVRETQQAQANKARSSHS